METNMQNALLRAGMTEERPLSKKPSYTSPTITMVEFAVEIGSLTSPFFVTSINNRNEYADTEQDGTETYSTTTSRGDFF